MSDKGKNMKNISGNELLKQYEAHLLGQLISNDGFDDFIDKWDKCELIVDYIVDWFNANCKLETTKGGNDALMIRFGEKYCGKKINFTHGVIQRVYGIMRKLDDDERSGLLLISETKSDPNFDAPNLAKTDLEFIEEIKKRGLINDLMFDLMHWIYGFCFEELQVLLNIILDKEENLTFEE